MELMDLIDLEHPDPQKIFFQYDLKLLKKYQLKIFLVKANLVSTSYNINKKKCKNRLTFALFFINI